MISDTLDIVAERCEVTGHVGLAKQRFELWDAEMDELLTQIVERVGAWQLLDLIDDEHIINYIDPDGERAGLEHERDRLERQVDVMQEKINELTKRLKGRG